MGKRVIVIGAGIAGLSAASYLQRNGFDTQIFEMHTRPGGLCTSWKRQGFTFDGCIHWLMGSGPSSTLHAIWKELGAADLDYVEWEVYAAARLSDGDSFTLYTDPARLEAELLRLGPEDKRIARTIASGVRKASRRNMPVALDKLPPAKRLKVIAQAPFLLIQLANGARRPVSKLIDHMKSPRLREAFANMLSDGAEKLPLAAFYMMLGSMAMKSSGYPRGGSDAFARAIEARYLALGGHIHYGSKVDEIIVEHGRATGVRVGKEVSAADYVISAADGHDTVTRLLNGRYTNPDLRAAFSGEGLRRYPSLIYIGLGLAGDWSAHCHMQLFTLREPLVLEGGALTVKRLSLRLFSFDDTLAPKGKTAATVMIETFNDAYWNDLKERDPRGYEAEKERAAQAVISALDREIPGFRKSVEVIDVATPHTFIHYTNNWHGSYEGWLPTPGSFMKKIPRTLAGLENFFMIGQWVNPGGGLPPGGMDGRSLAKLLCRKEGRRFSPD